MTHATGSTEAARLEIAVDPAADTAIGVLAHVDIDNHQGLVFAMNASGAPVGAPVAAPAGATLPLVQNGVATFLSTDTKTTTTTIFALAGGNVTPVANVMLSGHPVARLALSTGTAIVTSKRTEGYLLDALTLVRLDAAGAVLDEQPIGNTFAYSELEPVLGTTRNRDGSFAIAIVPDYQNGHGSIVRVDATGTVEPAKTASIALGSPAIALSLAQLDSDGFLVVALLAPTTGYALEAYRVREDGTTTVAPYLFPGQELVGGTSMVALPFEDHAVVVHDLMLPGGQRGIAVDALAASP